MLKIHPLLKQLGDLLSSTVNSEMNYLLSLIARKEVMFKQETRVVALPTRLIQITATYIFILFTSAVRIAVTQQWH